MYIHIPFCESKCGYCDFYSVKADENTHKEYVDALLKQIDEYGISARDNTVDSIFIGGGTPTSVGEELLVNIINQIKKKFKLAKNAEFTVETNPKTIDLKGLKKLYKSGINRLSIGMQSSDDKELKILSRLHSYDDFIECYENAKSAGFGNINVDVMYGIPSQTLKSFYATLRKVIYLKPAHISAYGLKIEPGTLFYKNLERLQPYLPGEEEERNMYFMCCELLSRNGYEQYEISNFAKRGYECRHNLKYWTCSEYIGLGAGAHSYFSNCRFSFKKDIDEYIKNLNYDRNKLENVDIFDMERYSLFDEYIQIKPNERIGEYVMLNFRLTEGINTNKFAKLFYKDFDRMYYDRIAPFINTGHIVRTSSGYAFSRDGMYISNYILSRIIDFEEDNVL